MKETYAREGGVSKSIVDDASSDYLHVVVESDEVGVWERNRAIRDAGCLRQDARSPLVEGDTIAFAFQFASYFDYAMAKLGEPDLFEQMETGTDVERTNAAQRYAVLHPEHVTTAPQARIFV